MTLNPNTDDETRDWIADETLALEGATVTRVRTHTSGDDVGYAVQVRPDTHEEPLIAELRADTRGDVAIPEEGDRVLVAYRLNGRPVVVGTRYTQDDSIPDFEEGERVLSHTASDAYIRFHSDGTLTVSGDGGNTIELQTDGAIVCNGGSTRPITDVDFANKTVTRASDVYLASN